MTVHQPKTVMAVMDAQTAYDRAKKAMGDGKDPKTKKAFVDAAMNLADAYMFGDVDQKVKYRTALLHYREVMKADPSNTAAKDDADAIVTIYKSMGREVPGGE
jgi:hypothetical protein